MRGKDSKCWHGVDWNGFGHRGGERLSEKGDSAFGFAVLWQELALEPRIRLGNEEWWRPQTPSAVGSVNLVVEKFLDMVDGEKVLAVH